MVATNARKFTLIDNRFIHCPRFSLEPRFQNLCDNNIPKPSAANSLPTASVVAPVAPATPSAAPSSPDRSPAAQPKKNQSLRQRINCLVVKTLAENQEKDKQNGLLPPAAASSSSPPTMTTTTPAAPATAAASPQPQLAPQTGLFHGDTWKIQILQNTRVISTVQEAQFVCTALAKGAQGDTSVVVSVDCEGINLGLKGQLTLIEVYIQNIYCAINMLTH